MNGADRDVRRRLTKWSAANAPFDVAQLFLSDRRLFEALSGASIDAKDDPETKAWIELVRRTKAEFVARLGPDEVVRDIRSERAVPEKMRAAKCRRATYQEYVGGADVKESPRAGRREDTRRRAGDERLVVAAGLGGGPTKIVAKRAAKKASRKTAKKAGAKKLSRRKGHARKS